MAGPDGFGIDLNKTEKGNFSLFIGNTYTRSSDAYNYTLLAALEECAKQGMYASVVLPVNYSKSRTYTAVSSYTNYLADGRGGYYPVTNTSSRPVTEVTPRYISSYDCQKYFYSIDSNAEKYENISRELVSPFTKDFKGGVLVKSISKKGMPIYQENDVITHIAGKRVETTSELNSVLQKLGKGKK